MQNETSQAKPELTAASAPEADEINLSDLAGALKEGWRWLIASTILAAGAGFLVASLLPKWYTARTVLLPPQQQQSSAAAAVSQLGALAGLAGGVGGLKSPADQYVALMQSATISDRLIDQFKLIEVYESEFRVDARARLAKNVRISASKKDGLITIDVDDHSPQRAAEMANAYVENLRTLTTQLAVTEAQQRRVFFEQQMREAKERLTQAQVALGNSGLGSDVLKAEPRSVAENYARLRAEVTAAEVKLTTLRRAFTENAPEVKQQESLIAALRQKLSREEAQDNNSAGSQYITKFRNFKYEEALFEIFSKQYELARVDESREGALIQIVDKATPPERKAGPRRLLITAGAGMFTLLTTALFFIMRKALGR